MNGVKICISIYRKWYIKTFILNDSDLYVHNQRILSLNRPKTLQKKFKAKYLIWFDIFCCGLEVFLCILWIFVIEVGNNCGLCVRILNGNGVGAFGFLYLSVISTMTAMSTIYNAWMPWARSWMHNCIMIGVIWHWPLKHSFSFSQITSKKQQKFWIEIVSKYVLDVCYVFVPGFWVIC